MSKPSAILLGSKPGSVAALAILLKRGWSVRAALMSRQDVGWPAGRSLTDFARRHGIPTVQSQSDLHAEPVDFVISYMCRSLVRAPTRALARRAAINFHAAPLPEFGGWAFYNVAILENATDYGCTCHYMDDGFDSGPLLRVRRFPIDATQETAFSLEQRTQEEMIRLLQEFCEIAESGVELPFQAQDPTRRRYLNREQFEALKQIPSGADEETIQRYARAFWFPPYQGATLKVGSLAVEVVPQVARAQLGSMLHDRDLERLMRVATAHDREQSAT